MSIAILNNYREKIEFYYNVVTNTFMSCEKYKLMNIMSLNDVNSCITSLEKLNNLLKTSENDNEDIINTLQFINNSLSNVIKLFGTFRVDDLLLICFGKTFYQKNILKSANYEKYKLISQFCHPINYKVLNWNNKKNQKRTDKNDKQSIQKNKIVDDNMLIERGENFDCFDLARTNQNFKIRISGLKFIIHNPENRQTIVIFCVVDDIVPNCMNYKFIADKLYDLNCIEFDDNIYNKTTWSRFIDTLTLKELFIYNIKELYDRYVGIINQVNLLKQKTIYQIVQDFVGSELYTQRNIIIQLLINSDKQEFQYIAYLLYDLLSNENNGNVDTAEQNNILDSLPWKYKQYFKEAMAQTISYTNKLHNFDNNKIPLEQQICLMKVNDYVKEKAMQKLKEVKSKADDSGSKARQYLEGLLKIPFNIFVREEIFDVKDCIKQEFTKLLNIKNSIDFNKYKNYPYVNTILDNIANSDLCSQYKDVYKNYNIYEIVKLLSHIKYNICIRDIFLEYIKKNITKVKKNLIIKSINYLNKNYFHNNQEKIDVKNDIDFLKECIYNFIDKNINVTNIDEDTNLVVDEVLEILSTVINKDIYQIYQSINVIIKKIERYNSTIINYINDTNNILDKSVYGHKNAKKSIERIIGQWINGETTGYCFGFEGPPGVGKTSLAKKGIANCLNNSEGVSRPFAFIAIGGSSNGSILDGHNYTYVGSSWGKIVDILIEKRCMNPIIFIDELDKVSKTEHKAKRL